MRRCQRSLIRLLAAIAIDQVRSIRFSMGDDVAQLPPVEKKKKFGGSFRIAREACQLLLDCKATAWQIGAYMTLSRHTDASGKYSTAAHKRIYETTGAAPGTEKQPGAARRLVQDLRAFTAINYDCEINKLIYTPTDWTLVTGQDVPDTPHKLFPVSFVLNDFNTDDWVWFANELVDGHGRFLQPLKRLKQCGDVAARLLLMAYMANNMEEYGGVQPLGNFFAKYGLIQHLSSSNGFTFHMFGQQTRCFSETVKTLTIGEYELLDNNESKVENALLSLESQGFVYEMVTVMDASPTSVDARPMYELHNRSKRENKGEEGLARRIDRVLSKAMKANRDLEYYVADSFGRYQKRLPVLSRVGVAPYVVGIFRLRFRVSNPKNYSVVAAWRRIGSDRHYWEGELNYLEKVFGISAKVSDAIGELEPEEIIEPEAIGGPEVDDMTADADDLPEYKKILNRLALLEASQE